MKRGFFWSKSKNNQNEKDYLPALILLRVSCVIPRYEAICPREARWNIKGYLCIKVLYRSSAVWNFILTINSDIFLIISKLARKAKLTISGLLLRSTVKSEYLIEKTTESSSNSQLSCVAFYWSKVSIGVTKSFSVENQAVISFPVLEM